MPIETQGGDCACSKSLRVLLGPFKDAAEAEDVKASVSKVLGGKPILIHHHPGKEGVEKSGG